MTSRSDKRQLEKDGKLRREAMRVHGTFAPQRLSIQASWCYERIGGEDLTPAQRQDLLNQAERLARVAHEIGVYLVETEDTANGH